MANTNEIYKRDNGIVSIMYHRFNEGKYPSTNISMDIFDKQIKIIRNKKLEIIDPKDFDNSFNIPKKNKKILITIDDGYLSFYKNAWPYLKKNKIPFILFISTKQIGGTGYMNWEQIKEIEKENFAYIGNHSYSHDYLTDFEFDKFEKDIALSIQHFKKNLGYNPIFFSYPFGEYNLDQKNYIKKLFKYAFGQHSGVIDMNKDRYELPRFPINEKYGDLKRFEFLVMLSALQYKKLEPENKILKNNNPPKITIQFFKNQKNLENINCFSNEGGKWTDAETEFLNNTLSIILKEKFIPRRGRVNCSLKDEGGWKWFGTQFVIK